MSLESFIKKHSGKNFLFILEEGEAQWEDEVSQEQKSEDYFVRVPVVYSLNENGLFREVYSPERNWDAGLGEDSRKYFELFNFDFSGEMICLNKEGVEKIMIGGIDFYQEKDSKIEEERCDHIETILFPEEKDIVYLSNLNPNYNFVEVKI